MLSAVGGPVVAVLVLFAVFLFVFGIHATLDFGVQSLLSKIQQEKLAVWRSTCGSNLKFILLLPPAALASAAFMQSVFGCDACMPAFLQKNCKVEQVDRDCVQFKAIGEARGWPAECVQK